MKQLSIPLLALALCGPALAAPCSIAWKDGHRSASDRAFNFEMRMSEGRGSCFVHGLAFMASAADDASVTCELRFFAGARVRNGWKVTVVADSGAFERVPATAPGHPPVLRVKAPPGETVRFVPRVIEVSGPASCTQWLDALEPAEGEPR